MVASNVVLLALVAFFPGAWGHPVWGKVFKVAVGAHTAYQFLKSRQRQKENSARFMDRGEEKRLFSAKNRGLLLDGRDRRLSHEDSFRNVAVVAATGGGKSSSFIIPNLLALDD